MGREGLCPAVVCLDWKVVLNAISILKNILLYANVLQ